MGVYMHAYACRCVIDGGVFFMVHCQRVFVSDVILVTGLLIATELSMLVNSFPQRKIGSNVKKRKVPFHIPFHSIQFNSVL